MSALHKAHNAHNAGTATFGIMSNRYKTGVSEQIVARVPLAMADALRRIAKQRGTDVSSVVRDALARVTQDAPVAGPNEQT